MLPLLGLFVKMQDKFVKMLELQLDNNRTIYIPGQKVEGHVALALSRPLIVKYLKIRFQGKVVTNLYKKDLIVNESSSVTMFKNHEYLLGDSTNKPVFVQGDEHVYPFQFRMPGAALEASFESDYGYVRYSLDVILETMEKKYSKGVVLSIPSSKNSQNTDYDIGPLVTTQGRVGLGKWFGNGFYSIVASLPRKAYSSEENAPLSIRIVNNSNHGLYIQSVSMKQQVTYTVSDRKRGPRTEKIHLFKYSEYIPPIVTEVERLIQFPIPNTDVMDPDIETAILEVSHLLDIKVKSECKYSPIVKLQVPLVIGGFPFYLFEDAEIISVATLPIYFGDECNSSDCGDEHLLRMTRTMETLRSEYESGDIEGTEALHQLADVLSDYVLISALQELSQEAIDSV